MSNIWQKQVGVVSLNGAIAVNFVVDPLSLPDCQSLPEYFLNELAALVKVLRVDGSVEISRCREQAAVLAGVMSAAVEKSTTP